MKKASQILFLISGIFSIIYSVLMFVFSILFIVFSNPEFKQTIIDGIVDGTIHSSFPGTPAEQAAAIQEMFLVAGVIFIFIFMFSVANAVLSFIARNKHNTGMFVVNIVFGFLSGIILNSIGGILGLVYLNQEKNNKTPQE